MNKITSKKIIKRAVASIAALMLCGFSSSAMAISCTNSFLLGTMGPPAAEFLGNSFSASGSYTDCYTFTLADSANLVGFEWEVDASVRRDIAVTGTTLFGGAVVDDETTGSALGTSLATNFSFSNLALGTYSLAFFVDVTGSDGGFLGGGLVGYGGTLATSTGSSDPTPPVVPTSVPEPSALALFALGMLGFAMKKRGPHTVRREI
jgi:hypothetical protein